MPQLRFCDESLYVTQNCSTPTILTLWQTCPQLRIRDRTIWPDTTLLNSSYHYPLRDMSPTPNSWSVALSATSKTLHFQLSLPLERYVPNCRCTWYTRVSKHSPIQLSRTNNGLWKYQRKALPNAHTYHLVASDPTSSTHESPMLKFYFKYPRITNAQIFINWYHLISLQISTTPTPFNKNCPRICDEPSPHLPFQFYSNVGTTSTVHECPMLIPIIL